MRASWQSQATTPTLFRPSRFICKSAGLVTLSVMIRSLFLRLAASELLHPRPQFDLPGPGAAGLMDEVHVALGDGVGIERAVGSVGGVGAVRAPDAAVDHDVSHVDALRRKLARHALGEAAQRELAHGEGRRLGIALDPRGGAGEQDRAVLLRQHAPCRLLGDEEAAIGGHRERLLHVERIELDERTAGAEACVVDHDVGRAAGRVEIGEQLLDLAALARVAGERPRAGLLDERIEVAGGARRKRDLDPILGQRPREGSGEPRTRANDERGIEFDIGHGEIRFVPLDARQTSTAGGSTAMARFLIVLGLAVLMVGLLWPYLSKLGLGRLPGGTFVERGNGTVYVPLAVCLLLSLLLSLVFGVANRGSRGAPAVNDRGGCWKPIPSGCDSQRSRLCGRITAGTAGCAWCAGRQGHAGRSSIAR